MRPRSFRLLRSGTAPALFLIFLYSLLPNLVPPTVAQTTQPFLFAGTYDSNTKSSGLVTLLRNSTTGVLSLLPNTAVTFKDPCNPSTMDPTGRFLFGVCGEGVAMYTLDSTTGIAAETAASPYSASVSTGQNSMLVTAESTGQYVYLLKVGTTEPPVPSTFTLDTFQIDSTTPCPCADRQPISFIERNLGRLCGGSRSSRHVHLCQSGTGRNLACGSSLCYLLRSFDRRGYHPHLWNKHR